MPSTITVTLKVKDKVSTQQAISSSKLDVQIPINAESGWAKATLRDLVGEMYSNLVEEIYP